MESRNKLTISRPSQRLYDRMAEEFPSKDRKALETESTEDVTRDGEEHLACEKCGHIMGYLTAEGGFIEHSDTESMSISDDDDFNDSDGHFSSYGKEPLRGDINWSQLIVHDPNDSYEPGDSMEQD